MRLRSRAQVIGYESVFAAGDCINILTNSVHGNVPARMKGLRTAHVAEAQAELCANNVLRSLRSAAREGQDRAGGTSSLLAYPRDVFSSIHVPLVSVVSLGECPPRSPSLVAPEWNLRV